MSRYRRASTKFLLLLSGMYSLQPVHSYGQEEAKGEALVSERVLTTISSDSGNRRLVQMSPQGRIILREERGNQITFLLSDMNNRFVETSLFTSPATPRPTVRFTGDGNFVGFSFVEDGKRILGIYNVSTRQRVFVRDPVSDVSGALVSPKTGVIVYQSRQEGWLPRLHIADTDGSNSRFITFGMGGTWSPDGKWFVVVRPRPYDHRGIEGLENRGVDKTWTYWIYGEKAKPVLELSDFEHPNMDLWSPNSKFLAVGVLTGLGFWVLDLEESGKGLVVNTTHHISPRPGERVEFRNPSWSPGGDKIVYVKSFLDARGHYYVKDEVWVTSFDGSKSCKLRESGGRIGPEIVWASNGNILITRKSGNREISIVELSVQNLDEVLK